MVSADDASRAACCSRAPERRGPRKIDRHSLVTVGALRARRDHLLANVAEGRQKLTTRIISAGAGKSRASDGRAGARRSSRSTSPSSLAILAETVALRRARGMTAAAVAPPAMSPCAAAAPSESRRLVSARSRARPTRRRRQGEARRQVRQKKSGARQGQGASRGAGRRIHPPGTLRRSLRAAKRATRSDGFTHLGLFEWTKLRLRGRGPTCSPGQPRRRRPRASARAAVSVAEFRERFEKPGCRASSPTPWRVGRQRGVDHRQSPQARFGDHRFKVGSDDDGYAVRLKFDHIHHYLRDPAHARDDSPSYIFDGSFGDKDGSKPSSTVAVPRVFQGGSRSRARNEGRRTDGWSSALEAAAASTWIPSRRARKCPHQRGASVGVCSPDARLDQGEVETQGRRTRLTNP